MTVSGLELPQRIVARELAVKAALLGLHHADKIHYSQGPNRWDGINRRLIAAKGEFPTETDCSGFVTWCEAQGLHFRFHVADDVNHSNWTGGWTGTLIDGGRQVLHLHNVIGADAVIYGAGGRTEHTAIVVSRRRSDGVPLVVSNGSEAGPFLLPYNYRPDVMQIRRYI